MDKLVQIISREDAPSYDALKDVIKEARELLFLHDSGQPGFVLWLAMDRVKTEIERAEDVPL